MGGIGPVYFEAKNAYARRYDIRESAFDDFLIFFGVLDDEYMAHVSEKQKAEQAKNKQT